MVLGVLANPRVAVVDVRLIDVLIDDLRHHNEPFRQKVRLFLKHNHTHISVQILTLIKLAPYGTDG